MKLAKIKKLLELSEKNKLAYDEQIEKSKIRKEIEEKINQKISELQKDNTEIQNQIKQR